ncbi:DUF2691 family protein [Bacillus vallismortis]|nr:DUF2691 family protein [Bacillus vallismortis]
MDEELDNEELFNDYAIVEGTDFANRLETNLQAFPFGKTVDQVETYEEFVDSDCELVLLLADSSLLKYIAKTEMPLKNYRVVTK